MNRDEFVAAMIAELSKQKASKGKNDDFFTGADLTAVDIYRKLCFDFPIVDDDMLEIFLNGVKAWGTQRDDFHSTFTLHEKMLYNLMTFQDQGAKEGQGSDGAVSRKAELVSCISAELYLSIPLRLLELPLNELAGMFHVSSSGSALQSDLLNQVRSYLCNMSLSQLTGALSSQYLASGGHLSKLLRVTDRLLALQQKLNLSQELEQKTDGEPRDLLQLIEFVYTSWGIENTSEEREQRLAWLREVGSSCSSLYAEIVCTFPELLPPTFAAYCAVHIGRTKQTIDPFSPEKPLPFLSHYLLLLGLSRISQAFQHKDGSPAVHKVRAAVDAVRCSVSKTSLLTDLVDVCTLIHDHNVPSSSSSTSTAGTGASAAAAVVDPASASFLVDLTLLLLPEDRRPSPSSIYNPKDLATALLSSRLLTQLAKGVSSTMEAYLLASLPAAPQPLPHPQHDAQYWALSIKQALAVTRVAAWDNDLARFLLSLPTLRAAWTHLASVLGNADQRAGMIAAGGSWRVVLGATLLTMMLWRQAGSTEDVAGLQALVVAAIQLAEQEVCGVEPVLAFLQQRDEREQEESLPGAPRAQRMLDSSAGRSIANYLRGLEAIEACCRMLTREDVPLLLSQVRGNGPAGACLDQCSQAWGRVVRALGASKAKACLATGDGHLMLVAALERTLRAAKGLMSLLEGGATSKSD